MRVRDLTRGTTYRRPHVPADGTVPGTFIVVRVSPPYLVGDVPYVVVEEYEHGQTAASAVRNPVRADLEVRVVS